MNGLSWVRMNKDGAWSGMVHLASLVAMVACFTSWALWRSALPLYAGVIEPGFAPPQTYASFPYPISVASGDIDSDGDVDLVMAEVWDDRIVLFFNNGNGNFTVGPAYTVANSPYQLILRDINNDHWLDIAIANQNYDINGSFTTGNSISVLLNQGGGVFGPRQDYGTGVADRSIAMADLDNDGDLDLVTASYRNDLTVLFNQGNGTFGPETKYARPQSSSVTIADVNGDQKPDFAVTNGPAGTASIFFNNGNGLFAREDVYDITPTSAADRSIHTSDFADLDGDGDLDWVVASWGTDKLYFLYNDGDGNFTPYMDCGIARPQFVYLRDFNKDELLDVIAVNHHSSIYNSVSILLGLPDGTFTQPVVVPMGNAAMELTLGDFNGDTNLDVATADYFGNTVTVRLMDRLQENPAGPGSPNCNVSTPPLHITTASPLPGGVVGQSYSAQLAAAGGVAPYTWSFTGTLPSGLTLDPATGLMSGIPTAAGTFGFTVQVTDSAAHSASKSFGIAPPPSNGSAGTGYTLPIHIDPTPDSGSDPGVCTNYTVVAGTLPAGLSLDANTGVVSGTPTNGGTYNFTIGCTVSGGQNTGQTATKEFTITIYNPAPTITSLAPAFTTAGGPDFVLTVNGANFVTASAVQWNGANRPTSYLSPTQLQVQIAAADIAAVGTANITVLNPAPGGGVSTAVPLLINPPPLIFTGFFQPVDNLPILNTAKAGSAIPVKFSLGGNRGLSILAVGYPASRPITCDTTAPTAEIEQTVTAGGSGLTYDAVSDQYSYIWKTEKAWAGSCRQLIVRLSDGSDHTANFKFK